MVKNKILFILFFIALWFPSNVLAEDKCYGLDLIRISEDLQLYQNCKQAEILYKEAIEELEKQNKLLKEQNDLLKKQIELYSTIKDNYEEIVDVQKQMIKASKPSIMQRFSDIGIGIVVGALIILLL